MWAHHVHKASPECAALINTRVRVKETGLKGLVSNVCPDKLGKPYQVHVKIDGLEGGPYIFGPDEVEPEQVN